MYLYSCRTLPRAIFLSMFTVIVAYVLANMAYFSVMTPQEILDSDAVAVVSSKMLTSFFLSTNKLCRHKLQFQEWLLSSNLFIFSHSDIERWDPGLG